MTNNKCKKQCVKRVKVDGIKLGLGGAKQYLSYVQALNQESNEVLTPTWLGLRNLRNYKPKMIINPFIKAIQEKGYEQERQKIKMKTK